MTEAMQAGHQKRGLRLSGIWIKMVLVFFFMYEFNLSAWGLPTLITSRRLVIFIALVCVIVGGRGIVHLKRLRSRGAIAYRNIMLFQAGILAYSGILLVMIGRGSGEHIFIILLRYFYMAGVGVFAFRRFFRDKDELLWCLMTATLIQVAFIVLFVVAPQLQTVCYRFTGETDSAAILNKRGYRTGFACSTSMGVLKMVPGMAACVYFYLKDINKGKKYIINLILMTLGATIIARTGLLLGLIAIFAILVGSGKAKRGGMYKAIAGLLVIMILGLLAVYVLNLDALFSGVFDRLLKLRENGLYNDFFAGYFGQIEGSKTVVPPICKETLIGTGITSGISGNGIAVNVDGGFARMYVAIGLPLAVVFYLVIYSSALKPCLRMKNVAFQYTMLYMAAYLVLGEFKEFFIDNGYAICVIFTLFLLHDEEEAKREV